jgi:hypothetical protein
VRVTATPGIEGNHTDRSNGMAKTAAVDPKAEADALQMALAPLYGQQEEANRALHAALARQGSATGSGLTESMAEVARARAELEKVTAAIGPLKAQRAALRVQIEAAERGSRRARIREAAGRVGASADSVETSAIAFFDALRVFVEAGHDTIGASLPDDRPTVARALDLGAVRAWVEQALDDIQFPTEPAKTLAGNLRPERPTTTAQAVADVVGQ